MRNKCLILIFLLLTSTYLYGDSGAEFLNIGVNPRAIALGNAYSAVSDDSSAVFWNPAGLNRIFNSDIFFMHQKWLFETDLEFLSVANRFDFGVIGLSMSYFHMPEFELFGSHGEDLGDASVYDLVFIGSYARKINGVLCGINLKYIRRVLDDVSVDAVAFDLGFIYSINFLKLYKSPVSNFDISFVIKNVGTKFSYETETENMPLTFTSGFKYNIQSKMNQKLFLAGDFSYRNDEPLIFSAGMEYNFFNMVFIRGGFKLEDERPQLVVGAGISYDISSFNLNFDMALFRFNEETLYPYSIGIRNSVNKSLKVSRVDLKKKVKKTDTLKYKGKTVIGFLNFKNLKNNSQLNYLSSSIPLSVNTILSKNTNLIIIETEKINSELDKIKINDKNQYDYMELYNNLGIGHLITGSFLEIEKRIKVNVKVINVKDNKIIFASSFESSGTGKNVFSLIDKVSADLADFYKK